MWRCVPSVTTPGSDSLSVLIVERPLLTGPCQAMSAYTARDAELRGNLARRRLGSERKDVKCIYARDSGNAGRQFARQVDAAAATDLRQGSLRNRDPR
jgi:hypothetical protein